MLDPANADLLALGIDRFGGMGGGLNNTRSTIKKSEIGGDPAADEDSMDGLRKNVPDPELERKKAE